MGDSNKVEIITDDSAIQIIEAYNSEAEEKYNRRTAARSLNNQPKRPDESSFSKLDSNLKKNTAFVRKIKNFNASQLPTLLNDVAGKHKNLTSLV